MVKELILQNWTLTLILIAFLVLVKTNFYLDKKTRNRMYILIVSIFLMSFIVFAEFYLEKFRVYNNQRLILMAIRYSSTPFIIAMTLHTLAKKERWYIFVPAVLLTVIDFISIFNGVVFSLDDDGALQRGILGYLPYTVVGVYCCFLVYILFRQENKQAAEIVPTIFLSFVFASGLILPFIIGKDYSKIFCTNVAIALFVYYDFSILQLTKKDTLTGVLNRQAYESEIKDNKKEISALVSVDMNGLKEINDKKGHAAGDKALATLALCMVKATKPGQLVYRIGGDEFMIICWKSSEIEIKRLIERIEKRVDRTEYFCAIGYSYSADGTKKISEMQQEADEAMYTQKEDFYSSSGRTRYRG
jgi:diguanylate cyclase (GGDEF)-like protein